MLEEIVDELIDEFENLPLEGNEDLYAEVDAQLKKAWDWLETL